MVEQLVVDCGRVFYDGHLSIYLSNSDTTMYSNNRNSTKYNQLQPKLQMFIQFNPLLNSLYTSESISILQQSLYLSHSTTWAAQHPTLFKQRDMNNTQPNLATKCLKLDLEMVNWTEPNQAKWKIIHVIFLKVVLLLVEVLLSTSSREHTWMLSHLVSASQ